jgi:tRNA(fMet)-specific endonuclease VapC
MKQAIIDTDTISYFFRGHQNVVRHLDTYWQKYGLVNVSVITYYEVLNGLHYKDAKGQLAKFEVFIQLNKILDLSSSIAQRAAIIHADLRKSGQIIGHNDILIAATAIVNDMTLITNNSTHFSRIPELQIDNWVL